VRTGGDALALVYDEGAADADWIALPVERLDPAFFDLRSGVAGELTQGFVQYGQRVAIVGDIAQHLAGSAALRAFVREADRGGQLWFVADVAELEARLG
jgi:hypothetical protein